jgi:hypothetical protein
VPYLHVANNAQELLFINYFYLFFGYLFVSSISPKQSLRFKRSTAGVDPERTLDEIVLTAENGTLQAFVPVPAGGI